MAPLTAQASPPDAEALAVLMAALARPVPNQTAFVERRGSTLLEQPQLLRGSLAQPDADTLVREVLAPYPETSVIEGERVRITREDGRERRFSLRRAPELAALRDSFQGLLAGDAGQLEQHFELGLSGTPSQWRLQMDPLHERLSERVAGLVAYGRDGELLCLVTEDAEGGRSELLLGSAADGEAPDFDGACALADGATDRADADVLDDRDAGSIEPADRIDPPASDPTPSA